MYVVRDVFQLQFGKARQAREALEGFSNLGEENDGPSRILTDFTGPSYRLIMEFEFESLGEYEERLTSIMSSDDWRDVYGSFVPYVESSYREILRTVD
jgi:hypothetical protein